MTFVGRNVWTCPNDPRAQRSWRKCWTREADSRRNFILAGDLPNIEWSFVLEQLSPESKSDTSALRFLLLGGPCWLPRKIRLDAVNPMAYTQSRRVSIDRLLTLPEFTIVDGLCNILIYLAIFFFYFSNRKADLKVLKPKNRHCCRSISRYRRLFLIFPKIWENVILR